MKFHFSNRVCLESTLTIQAQTRKKSTIITAKAVLPRFAHKRKSNGVNVVLEKFKSKTRKIREIQRVVRGMPLTGDGSSTECIGASIVNPGIDKSSKSVQTTGAVAVARTALVPLAAVSMAAVSSALPTAAVPQPPQLPPLSLIPKTEPKFYSQQSTAILTRNLSSIQLTKLPRPVQLLATLPDGITDYDHRNRNDPFEVAEYAMDIFDYYKQRESDFLIVPYMERQTDLTSSIRAQLIDWMVQLHEYFELNNETLYLATKILDIYLSRIVVKRERLRIIASAALLVASKYDEQEGPQLQEFVILARKKFQLKELIAMERNVYKTIGFDLGIPLSYTFLRRYAKCGDVCMKELTLARYILELSLLYYQVVPLSSSKLACASLLIALTMYKQHPWNTNLEYYSGYKIQRFFSLVPVLNEIFVNHNSEDMPLCTIREKYEHTIFFEVAKIPVIETTELLEMIAEVNDM